MPASIERVGKEAFCECKGAVVVEFAEGGCLREIGVRAFAGCAGLQHVVLPEGSCLSAIGHEAFYRCEGLQHVSIPEGTLAVHARAFDGCKDLRLVELPTLTSPLGYKDPKYWSTATKYDVIPQDSAGSVNS